MVRVAGRRSLSGPGSRRAIILLCLSAHHAAAPVEHSLSNPDNNKGAPPLPGGHGDRRHPATPTHLPSNTPQSTTRPSAVNCRSCLRAEAACRQISCSPKPDAGPPRLHVSALWRRSHNLQRHGQPIPKRSVRDSTAIRNATISQHVTYPTRLLPVSGTNLCGMTFVAAAPAVRDYIHVQKDLVDRRASASGAAASVPRQPTNLSPITWLYQHGYSIARRLNMVYALSISAPARILPAPRRPGDPPPASSPTRRSPIASWGWARNIVHRRRSSRSSLSVKICARPSPVLA